MDLAAYFTEHHQVALAKAYYEKARSYLQTQPNAELEIFISFNLLRLSAFDPAEFQKENGRFKLLIEKTPRMRIGDEDVLTSVIHERGDAWFKERFSNLRPLEQPLPPPELAWTREPHADWTWRMRRLIGDERFRELTGISPVYENLLCLAQEVYRNPTGLQSALSLAEKLQYELYPPEKNSALAKPLNEQLWDQILHQLIANRDLPRLKLFAEATPYQFSRKKFDLLRAFPENSEMVIAALSEVRISSTAGNGMIEALRAVLKHPHSPEALDALASALNYPGTEFKDLTSVFIERLRAEKLSPETAVPLIRGLLAVHTSDNTEVLPLLMDLLKRFEANEPARDLIVKSLPAYDALVPFDLYTAHHPDRPLAQQMRMKYAASDPFPLLSLLPYAISWRSETGASDSFKKAMSGWIKMLSTDSAEENRRHLPMILTQLKEAAPNDTDFCDSLASLLGDMGAEAESALPTLRQAFAARPDSRYALLSALVRVGEAKDNLPLILKNYPPESVASEHKVELLRALAAMGAEASVATPMVFATLAEENKDFKTKAAALRALVSFNVKSAQIGEAVDEVLKREKWGRDALTAFAAGLGRAGRASRDLAPQLVAHLQPGKARSARQVQSEVLILQSLTQLQPLPPSMLVILQRNALRERHPQVASAYRLLFYDRSGRPRR